MNAIELDARTKRQKQGQWSTTIEKNWLRLLILALALHIFFNKDITIEFNLNSAGRVGEPMVIQPIGYHQASHSPAAAPVSLPETSRPVEKEAAPANDYSNLAFILNPSVARRKNVDRRIVRQKLRNCEDYVARFAPIAEREREEYGIPVSITLAQGLLESDAGDSRLAVESNNHFGIKCRTKCRGCTCRNYSDDDIYDMFRVFESPRESYREHSILLNNQRYKHLKKFPVADYQSWAYGLKKAGYATDKRYAEKLIRIIETLKLDRFDRRGA